MSFWGKVVLYQLSYLQLPRELLPQQAPLIFGIGKCKDTFLFHDGKI